MRLKITLVIVCLFTSFYANAKVIESIAAVVNGDIILKGEVETQFQFYLIRQNINPNTLTQSEIQERKDQILEIMIDDLLIEQAVRNRLSPAQKQLIDERVESLTNEEMDEFKKQYNTAEKLASLEREQGLSWDEIRQLRKRLIYKDYLRWYVVPRFVPQQITPPTPQEIAQYQKEHPNEEASGKLLIAHILLKVPPGATQEEESRIKERADEIAQRVKLGESFEKLVELYSDHTITKRNGGRLPEFQKGDYYEEFNPLFDLEEGAISDPIRTRVGYHIVKVLDKKTIEDLVMKEKGRKITMEWIEQLRKNSTIQKRL